MLGRTRPLLALLALVLAAGCSGRAYSGLGKPEKPAVVVLDVKGKRGVKARGAIVDLLEGSDYQLIPRKRYIKTARKLRATKLRARHIREVSAELGISAVIAGRVKRRGKRQYLYVNVYDGSSGKRVERFRVRLTRRRSLTSKGSRRLESQLTAALGEVKPPGERDEVVAGESDKDDEPPKSEREDDAAARKKAEADARAEREAKAKADAEREKAKAERERKAREEKERREKEKEAAVIEEVANPETNDSGQVLDEEEPPGF